MIKKYLTYSLAVLVLSFSSCSEWLNTKPESEIILED